MSQNQEKRIKCFKCGKMKLGVQTKIIEGVTYIFKYCSSCRFTNIKEVQVGK